MNPVVLCLLIDTCEISADDYRPNHISSAGHPRITPLRFTTRCARYGAADSACSSSGEIDIAYLVHRCRGFCFFGARPTHEEGQWRQQKHHNTHEPECVYEGKCIGLKIYL
jgi:hypothetical protein